MPSTPSRVQTEAETEAETAGVVLCLVGAGPAGLELAVIALEDEPVRAGLADAAVPQDQRGVGLDDLEGVGALAWIGHSGRWSWPGSGFC